MYLALNDIQEMLVEAATEAVSRQDTIAATREANDGAEYPDVWPVAVAAGWPGLLVDESTNGAGLSAYDAMLVVEACGSRLADSRLLGHLPATALLQASGSHGALLAALAGGDKRAALLDLSVADPGAEMTVRADDGFLVFDGTLGGVLDVIGADTVVIVGELDGAPVAGVADADVVAAPQASYDGSRLVADLEVCGLRAERLGLASDRVRDGADLQQALIAAEAVGAAQACLTMARDYAVERKAFGRSIGSYQAIKHKLVEMLRRVEHARSATVGAGRAWEYDRPSFALEANAARVTAMAAVSYCAPENIFIHGGVGATWEHDASVFYRRAEHTRRLAGGTDAAADRVAGELLAGETPLDERELASATTENRS